MLSGCCIVTAKSHDVERFIRDGENGFITLNNPITAANLIEKLLYDYELAIKVGQEGKKTAKEFFSKDRFQKEWMDLIKRIIK